jgi:hypothetical protein
VINRILMIIAVSGFIAMAGITGCESTSDQKVEIAEDNLREAKQDVNEAVTEALTAYQDEWQSFRFDVRARLRDNQYTISGYRKIKAAGDATKRRSLNIKNAEFGRRNNALIQRVRDYRDEGRVKWEEFKNGILEDLDTLGDSLKAFKVNQL